MAKKLSERKLKQIAKLPKEIQAWKDKYPNAVYNVSEAWDVPPLPEGHIPEDIAIYYADETMGSDILIYQGVLHNFELDPPKDKKVIKMAVDDDWAYIQVERTVLLDRLGGVVLPDILTRQDKLLEFTLNNFHQI